MDPYLLVLIKIIILIGALVLVILTAIIIMRLKAEYDQKKYKLWEAEIEAFYLDYLLGDRSIAALPQKFKQEKHYYWQRRFFTPYLETLDGADFEATKALCRETGLITYHRSELLKGSKLERAVAAKFLGILRYRESVPERIRLLKSKDQLLVLAAAQGLTVSENPSSFETVLKALLYDTYYTYEGVTEILSRYGSEICEPISAVLEKYISETRFEKAAGSEERAKKVSTAHGVDYTVLVIIMIDLLGHYRYRKGLPLLARLLNQADTETIIHVFKAFLRIGEVPANFDVKPYLVHEAWPVRSFAAQVAVIGQDNAALPLLDQLLTDSQWWVRYYAALALLSYGDQGLAILKRRAGGPDAEASAVSNYILSRKEVG